ncbi:MAG: tetratricopeptide repeat protein [Anaerolineales bacterium]|nr:tetratricopeptide repeat protein [Anaerolineales bacterium]
MNRRKRRPNYFGWLIFVLVVVFGYLFNQVYLPSQPNPFENTPTPTRSPESFVTEAEALYKEGKLTQAIEAYQQAINSAPQDSTLYVALARVQVFAGQYEDAQKNAENAILLNNDNALAHGVLAWALDFQEGKNGDAQISIEKALALDPNNALLHAYNTEILIDSGFDGYEKAIDESKVALALDSNIIETRRARALVYEATGNYAEAILEYQAAININPNIPILYIGLGLNYRRTLVYEDAITAFIKANSLNPADPLPDLYISRTFATTGQYEKAVQYGQEAVNNRPDSASLRGNLGVMYFRQYMWPEAVKELGFTIYGGVTEDGVKITGIPLVNEPLVAEYYYTYGLALARTNQCGEAIQMAQTVQTRVPSNEDAAFAASEIIRICQEQLSNPPTSTPAFVDPLAVTSTSTPVETPTVATP